MVQSAECETGRRAVRSVGLKGKGMRTSRTSWPEPTNFGLPGRVSPEDQVRGRAIITSLTSPPGPTVNSIQRVATRVRPAYRLASQRIAGIVFDLVWWEGRLRRPDRRQPRAGGRARRPPAAEPSDTTGARRQRGVTAVMVG